MGGLLTLIGAVGFIGYLIWLVVCIRNWDSKIPPVIGMILSMVMLSGGLMWVAETEPPTERKTSTERSEPAETREDTPEKEADAPAEEVAPAEEEDGIECLTHEIPQFGIAFDCPVAFGTEGKSNVVAEDEVNYSISSEDRVILFTCSRISSLSRAEELFHLAGKDPSILYENYESLNLDAAIASWSEMYQTFDLLDGFSAPKSYGFYYAAADNSFGELITEMGYRYKNYGGFVDDGGVIQVLVLISVPQDTDREDFFTLCETVTNSIRFSE